MNRVGTVTRISLSLALITLSLLFGAQLLGLVGDDLKVRLDARQDLCEVIAIQLSTVSQSKEVQAIQSMAMEIVNRNADLLSLAVRRNDNEILIQTPDHETHWQGVADDSSTSTHVRLPLFRNSKRWAMVELCMRPLIPKGFSGILAAPGVRLATFVALAAFLTYMLYLRKVLRHLDPSTVIPERVKTTLNTLSEGILVPDQAWIVAS